jgi:hypothetical protein
MPRISIFLYFLFISVTGIGQINITYPSSRAIFQRNNSNQSSIYIAGNFTQKATKIEAKAIARTMSPTQGTSTSWQTLVTNPQNGFYSGTITLQGGWYDIYVRAWQNNTLLGTDSLQRVGVGEVFVIAGQSNATGAEELRQLGNYGTSASDDRVSFVNYSTNWSQDYSKVVLPLAVFQHADSTSRIAPMGVSGWCWGALGDLLTRRLNVPIAFFNAAWPSCQVGIWSSTANDSTLSAPFIYPLPKGIPYGHLRTALNFYIAQFGIRAVLWHQGETDNAFSTTRVDYATQLKNVIEKSRIHSNKPNLTWVVSRVSHFKGLGLTTARTWQPVIDAQNDVIGLNGISQTGYTTKVVPGPETDNYTGPRYRDSDDVHFKGLGHSTVAGLWSNALTDNFFQTTTPYLPISLPTVYNTCVSSNKLNIQLNASFSNVQWTRNTTATDTVASLSNISATSGSYIARVKDNRGNILLTPKINIPSNFSGLIPIQSLATGNWNNINTWSCGRIPTILDDVTIQTGHLITLPTASTGNFRDLTINGQVIFTATSFLKNN